MASNPLTAFCDQIRDAGCSGTAPYPAFHTDKGPCSCAWTLEIVHGVPSGRLCRYHNSLPSLAPLLLKFLAAELWEVTAQGLN